MCIFVCKYLSVRVCVRVSACVQYITAVHICHITSFFDFFYSSLSVKLTFFLHLFIDLLSPHLQHFHSQPSIFNSPPPNPATKKEKQTGRMEIIFIHLFLWNEELSPFLVISINYKTKWYSTHVVKRYLKFKG